MSTGSKRRNYAGLDLSDDDDVDWLQNNNNNNNNNNRKTRNNNGSSFQTSNQTSPHKYQQQQQTQPQQANANSNYSSFGSEAQTQGNNNNNNNGGSLIPRKQTNPATNNNNNIDSTTTNSNKNRGVLNYEQDNNALVPSSSPRKNNNASLSNTYNSHKNNNGDRQNLNLSARFDVLAITHNKNNNFNNHGTDTRIFAPAKERRLIPRNNIVSPRILLPGELNSSEQQKKVSGEYRLNPGNVEHVGLHARNWGRRLVATDIPDMVDEIIKAEEELKERKKRLRKAEEEEESASGTINNNNNNGSGKTKNRINLPQDRKEFNPSTRIYGPCNRTVGGSNSSRLPPIQKQNSKSNNNNNITTSLSSRAVSRGVSPTTDRNNNSNAAKNEKLLLLNDGSLDNNNNNNNDDNEASAAAIVKQQHSGSIEKNALSLLRFALLSDFAGAPIGVSMAGHTLPPSIGLDSAFYAQVAGQQQQQQTNANDLLMKKMKPRCVSALFSMKQGSKPHTYMIEWDGGTCKGVGAQNMRMKQSTRKYVLTAFRPIDDEDDEDEEEVISVQQQHPAGANKNEKPAVAPSTTARKNSHTGPILMSASSPFGSFRKRNVTPNSNHHYNGDDSNEEASSESHHHYSKTASTVVNENKKGGKNNNNDETSEFESATAHSATSTANSKQKNQDQKKKKSNKIPLDEDIVQVELISSSDLATLVAAHEEQKKKKLEKEEQQKKEKQIENEMSGATKKAEKGQQVPEACWEWEIIQIVYPPAVSHHEASASLIGAPLKTIQNSPRVALRSIKFPNFFLVASYDEQTGENLLLMKRKDDPVFHGKDPVSVTSTSEAASTFTFVVDSHFVDSFQRSLKKAYQEKNNTEDNKRKSRNGPPMMSARALALSNVGKGPDGENSRASPEASGKTHEDFFKSSRPSESHQNSNPALSPHPPNQQSPQQQHKSSPRNYQEFYEEQVARAPGKANILTEVPPTSMFVGPGPDCQGIVFSERYCVVTMDSCLAPSNVLFRITETFIEDETGYVPHQYHNYPTASSPNRLGTAESTNKNFLSSSTRNGNPYNNNINSSSSPSASTRRKREDSMILPQAHTSQSPGGSKSPGHQQLTPAHRIPNANSNQNQNHHHHHNNDSDSPANGSFNINNSFTPASSPLKLTFAQQHGTVVEVSKNKQKGCHQSWRFYNDDSSLTITVTAKFRGARDSAIANTFFAQVSLIGLDPTAMQSSMKTHTGMIFAAMNANASRNPNVQDRSAGRDTSNFEASTNHNQSHHRSNNNNHNFLSSSANNRQQLANNHASSSMMNQSMTSNNNRLAHSGNNDVSFISNNDSSAESHHDDKDSVMSGKSHGNMTTVSFARSTRTSKNFNKSQNQKDALMNTSFTGNKSTNNNNNNNNGNGGMTVAQSLAAFAQLQQTIKSQIQLLEITETIPPGATVHFFSGFIIGDVSFAFDAF